MKIIASSTYRRMPWKNGGGETIEIAASPEGASLDSFEWRVSMARVDHNGPFSVFPDVDRTLAVLDGIELALHFADGAVVRLTPESEPYAFPADAPVTASLRQGGIDDLNVMTRRGRVSHKVRRHLIDNPANVTSGAGEMLVLLRGGAARVLEGARERDLDDGDSFTLVAGEDVTIVPRGRASLYVVAFQRR